MFRFFLAHSGRVLLLWLLLPLVLTLAGCASQKNVSSLPGEGMPYAGGNRFALPDDDGKPLTAAERKAFFSEGDFDRGLSSAQLSDVLRHFKQLVHRERGTVRESVSLARHYLPMIHAVLRENGLPQELAYLPFVESNYSVFVRSRSEALGLWQFIPSTAAYYGMKFDAWTDERRDPRISTRTAAVYLAKLRDFFDGDWHLAISAYNAGEGKIRRGMDATGARTFFELRDRDGRITEPRLKMTDENRQYLPKFLAACKIMRNLELLGFEPVGQAPSLAAVRVKPGVDLGGLARQAGVSWDTFMLQNAYYLRRYSPPGRYTTAMVPANRQESVQHWMKTVKATKTYDAWRPYTVRANDSVRSVARKTGTSEQELMRVNQLDGKTFRAGAVMLIPPVKKVAAKKTPSGAKKTAPSKKQLASSSVDARAQALAAQIAGGKKARKETYTVRAGDSIWSIARRFNIPPKQLLTANGMTVDSARVRPGDVIVIK